MDKADRRAIFAGAMQILATMEPDEGDVEQAMDSAVGYAVQAFAKVTEACRGSDKKPRRQHAEEEQPAVKHGVKLTNIDELEEECEMLTGQDLIDGGFMPQPPKPGSLPNAPVSVIHDTALPMPAQSVAAPSVFNPAQAV